MFPLNLCPGHNHLYNTAHNQNEEIKWIEKWASTKSCGKNLYSNGPSFLRVIIDKIKSASEKICRGR